MTTIFSFENLKVQKKSKNGHLLKFLKGFALKTGFGEKFCFFFIFPYTTAVKGMSVAKMGLLYNN